VGSCQIRKVRYADLRPLPQITTDAAREFARKRLDEGVSNDTVNGSLRLLRRMLILAHEDKKIQVVPKIRLLKGTPQKRFPGPRAIRLTRSFLPINLKPLIIFLYYCGVRLGEAEQIDWPQVDLKSALTTGRGGLRRHEFAQGMAEGVRRCWPRNIAES